MQPFDVTNLSGEPWQWLVFFSAAVLIGMSKTGLQGINTISIPLLAIIFGARESTGIILPMLCFADLVAVIYYRSSAEWKYIVKLLPWAILGFFVAIAVDKYVPVQQFRYLMAGSVFISLIIIAIQAKSTPGKSTQSGAYASFFGLVGGFSTMIGNAAGPIMAVYLISMRMPKMAFVGTSAWFFFIINLLKLPLQGFVWHNISVETLTLGALGIPAILLGAVFGISLVKRVPEKSYRLFIIILTAVSALLLLV